MAMLNQIFDAPFLFFIAKLSLAMLLGLLLGLERIYAHKTAGMRTYALVSVATAFFVSMSVSIGDAMINPLFSFNPMLVAGSVITGIGFLGAGLIIFKDGHIENLTTAAGMWACAGIGMAVGFGMFREAIFASVLIFFVIGILSTVERFVRLKVFPDPEFEAFEKKMAKKRIPVKVKKSVN